MYTLKDVDTALKLPNNVIDPAVDDAIVALSEQANSLGDSKMLDVLWCYQAVSRIQSLYLQAFERMGLGATASAMLGANGCESDKSRAYLNAWTNLVDCERLISALTRNYCIEGSSLEEFRIVAIWHDVKRLMPLFPYKYFLSEERVVAKRYCSICGASIFGRNKCGHLQGRLYGGRICRYRVAESMLKAVSIVEKPMDKKCVLTVHNHPYSFTLLDSLIPAIKPFDNWSYSVIRRLGPEYCNANKNDPCPCGSGLEFEKCLQVDRQKHLVSHYSFILPAKNTRECWVLGDEQNAGTDH